MINLTNNERFAYDSYRRFLTMFGSVAWDIERDKFEHVLDEVKAKEGVKLDTEVSVEGLKSLIEPTKQLLKLKQEKIFLKILMFNCKQLLKLYSALGTFLVRLLTETTTTKLTTTTVLP